MGRGGAGAPLDLRKLRYFVAVAQELHFGRAAQRLYITQPVLSRQIRQLESELGVDLFERTSRRVVLTPAGELLLADGPGLLAAAEATRRRVSGAGDGPRTLTVGFFVGDTFTAALRAFGQECPDVDVRLHRLYWQDQVTAIHDGTVDVAFVHLPIDDDGLELLPVRTEPRVAVLASTHPLAGRETVSIAELADDPVLEHRGASAEWQAFHDVDPRADGRRPRRGPAIDNIEEKLEQVAAGTAISFVPASAAAAVVHSGVRFVVVDDIPPTQVCLAWSRQRRSTVVDAFVRAVRASRTGTRGGASRGAGAASHQPAVSVAR